MTLLACWKRPSKKKLVVCHLQASYIVKISIWANVNTRSMKYIKNFISFAAKDMEDMTLDELDELEDEEEERVLEQYRQQRIAQIKSLQQKSR